MSLKKSSKVKMNSQIKIQATKEGRIKIKQKKTKAQRMVKKIVRMKMMKIMIMANMESMTTKKSILKEMTKMTMKKKTRNRKKPNPTKLTHLTLRTALRISYLSCYLSGMLKLNYLQIQKNLRNTASKIRKRHCYLSHLVKPSRVTFNKTSSHLLREPDEEQRQS